MQIVFIHGPAAAGKFTVGKCLSKISGFPLFHNHLTVDLALSLFEFGSPPFVDLRESIWLNTFAAAAAADRSFIFTFHPEASVRPDFIRRAEQAVQAHGGVISFVELLCSDRIIEERIGIADRAQYGKLTDIGLYQEIKSQGGFRFPSLPRPVVQVDTSRTQPQAAAERIWSALSA